MTNERPAAVLIVMGSDSDLEVMKPAVDALAGFGVRAEVRVLSAHRTPDQALDLARSAADRGIRAIIAGAGWAAHLPGVLAAVTTLPVIGVPIAASPLAGLDSLLAIVQMPSGVPVATVGTNGARNAALLAVRIMAVADPGLRARLEQFQRQQAEGVLARDAAVRAQFE
jgi:phosphoribosylaminoimidazole carboxylase PurE protein